MRVGASLKVTVRVALVCAAILGSASAARAQCSQLFMPLLYPVNTNKCTQNSTSDLVLDGMMYEVHAQTACLQGGWVRSYHQEKAFFASAFGACGPTPPDTRPYCEAAFVPYDLGFDPTSGKHRFRVTEYSYSWNDGCVESLLNHDDDTPSEDCQGYSCCSGHLIAECSNAQGDFNSTTCECNFATPLLIDMKGDGYQLTSFRGGIRYDLMGNGSTRQISWTAAGGDDAFVVLDRNGKGTIDNGTELFGSGTPLNGGVSPNGFEALKTYDTNGDGLISAADDVFGRLQLWADTNHDGVSQPGELVFLSDPRVDIEAISLKYRLSQQRDKFGNWFKYRSRLYGGRSRYLVDVYFLITAGQTRSSTKHRP